MNPNPCQHALDLLVDYLSGDLPSEIRSELEIHFRDCSPCTAYLQTYRLTVSMTRQLPLEAPLPPEFEARLLEMARLFRDTWGR